MTSYHVIQAHAFIPLTVCILIKLQSSLTRTFYQSLGLNK